MKSKPEPLNSKGRSGDEPFFGPGEREFIANLLDDPPEPTSTMTAIDLIYQRAEELAESEAGRESLACLDKLMEGRALDAKNQANFAALLESAWGAYAGTTRDAVREFLLEGSGS